MRAYMDINEALKELISNSSKKMNVDVDMSLLNKFSQLMPINQNIELLANWITVCVPKNTPEKDKQNLLIDIVSQSFEKLLPNKVQDIELAYNMKKLIYSNILVEKVALGEPINQEFDLIKKINKFVSNSSEIVKFSLFDGYSTKILLSFHKNSKNNSENFQKIEDKLFDLISEEANSVKQIFGQKQLEDYISNFKINLHDESKKRKIIQSLENILHEDVAWNIGDFNQITKVERTTQNLFEIEIDVARISHINRGFIDKLEEDLKNVSVSKIFDNELLDFSVLKIYERSIPNTTNETSKNLEKLKILISFEDNNEKMVISAINSLMEHLDEKFKCEDMVDLDLSSVLEKVFRSENLKSLMKETSNNKVKKI